MSIALGVGVGPVFGGSIATIDGDWILASTNWADSGLWIDTENWMG